MGDSRTMPPSPAACDVVVLCGGLGTRLSPVVSDRPKPMAEINGRPFLELLVEHLALAGFRRFILGTGHMGEVIDKAFAGRPSGPEVLVSHETSPLGTAGGLRNALALIKSDTIAVLNGDSFCRVDYAGMLGEHAGNRADATMAVVASADRGDCGNVVFGPDHRVTLFSEKPEKHEGTGYVNAGVYLIQRAAVESMEKRTPLSLERDVFPALVEARFYAHETPGPLVDIGTPERYERARRELARMMKR